MHCSCEIEDQDFIETHLCKMDDVCVIPRSRVVLLLYMVCVPHFTGIAESSVDRSLRFADNRIDCAASMFYDIRG